MKPNSYRLFQCSPVVVTGIASLLAASAVQAVNTQKNVAAAATDLFLAASYDPAGVSTATSDVTFLVYQLPLGDPPVPLVYANAATLVMSNNVGMGTLNVLNTTPLTVTTSNASIRTLTLNGGGNTVSIAEGGTAADLIYLDDNTSLTLQKVDATSDFKIALPAAGGDLNVMSGAALKITAIVSAGAFNKTGDGTLTLGGNNTFTGVLNIKKGTLSINTINNSNSNGVLGKSTTSVTLGDTGAVTSTLSYTGLTGSGSKLFTMATGGTGVFEVTDAASTLTLSGVIDGGGAMQKKGPGQLSLSNTANTFSGGLAIIQGSVKLGGTGKVLGDDANLVSVTSDAALDLGGRNSSAVNALTLNGTGVSSGGALTNSSTSAGTYPGLVTLGSTGVSIGGTGLVNLTNAGSITGTDHNLTLRGGGGTITSSIDTGAGSVTVNATGTWTLNGTNTHSGGTDITAGTLRVGGSTGAVSVTAGTLLVNGTTTTVSLSAAGTLGGINGTVTGAVGMVSGSTVAPGTTTSIGTLNTTGNLAFVPGAVLDLDISTDTTTADYLNVGGNLDLAGATLSPANLGTVSPASLAVFTIATYTGTLTGEFAGLPEGALVPIAGRNYTLRYADGGNFITLTAPLATPYETWAALNITSSDPSADPTPEGDPDKDGANNLAEFAFNGNPLSGSNNGQIYVLTEDSELDSPDTDKELILTVAVLSGAPTFAGSPSPVATVDGVTYTIQGSTTLENFDTVVNVVPTPVTTGLPEVGAGYVYRSFSLSGSNGLAGKGFLRAKAAN